MYDVVIMGQGLTGMLSAIWAKEQGFRTAVVAAGTGRIVQSSGVMDLIPGADRDLKEWLELYQIDAKQKPQLSGALEKFKSLTEKLGYPYKGEAENPVAIVTGSGHIKKTVLYPETIKPVPEKGHVVIVGFQEVADFQPEFVKGNLQKERPMLEIDTIKIKLGRSSQRTMTQLDAARLLDQADIRNHCIQQIKDQMVEKKISKADLFVFPASLGVDDWKENVQQFSIELQAEVTEAPGMPPNATAIRLNERLKKQAVMLGVRFYSDTTVTGCHLEGEEIQSLRMKTANQQTVIAGKHFILATGGVLGGGQEITGQGMKETALNLVVNEYGEIVNLPSNLDPLGAGKGIRYIHHGITGGVYSILSSYETVCKLQQLTMGGTRSA